MAVSDEAAIVALVRARLAEELNVSEEQVRTDFDLQGLGLSSISLMSLVYELEDELDIVLEDQALLEVRTIDDLLALVESRRATVTPPA